MTADNQHPPHGEKAWELVLGHVEKQLATGALNPGDRLPGERILAVELGVGRSSVREAIRVLDALGLIRTQTGSGPSAGAIVVSRPSGGMSMLMRLQVAAQGFAVTDVVKTRLILESAVVRELAETPSAHLDESHELLAVMDNPELSPTEFLVLDAQYHLSLAQATGNEVLAATMAGLRSAIEHYVIEASASIPNWGATRLILQEQHRSILQAIQLGDAVLANSRTAAHIEGYYTETRLHEHSRTNTPTHN